MTASKPKLVRASDPAAMPAVTATPAAISIHPIENCSSRTAPPAHARHGLRARLACGSRHRGPP
jgi:hypothetical protein